MQSDSIKRQPRLSRNFRRAYWIIPALFLLVTLAGCLTTYASGYTEQEHSTTPTVNHFLPTTSATSTPGVTTKPGFTLVPNAIAHAFQTITPTVTTTPTLTATPSAEPTATVTPKPTTAATSAPTATATPEPTATSTPRPTDTPQPTTISATAAPFQAYAWVDNIFPAPGSVVTVHGRLFKNGRPVNGAHMGATWSYTHGQAYCSAYSGIDGRAACAQNIGAPLPNYWVYVDVVFVIEDELYYAKTSFLTDP